MKSIWDPYEIHMNSIWNPYEIHSENHMKSIWNPNFRMLQTSISSMVKSIHFQVPRSPVPTSRQEIVPKTSPAELVLWASYRQVPRRFVFPWDSHGNIGWSRLAPAHKCPFCHWHDNLRHLWCLKVGFPEDFGCLSRAGWFMEGKFHRTGIGGGPSTLGSFPRTW